MNISLSPGQTLSLNMRPVRSIQVLKHSLVDVGGKVHKSEPKILWMSNALESLSTMGVKD